MAEFVNGYEAMGRIGPYAPFWFSTNKAEDPYYLQKIAYKISKWLRSYAAARHMERGNKGSTSWRWNQWEGLNIVLPFEQHFNPYIDE
jgi:hypothetical protein